MILRRPDAQSLRVREMPVVAFAPCLHDEPSCRAPLPGGRLEMNMGSRVLVADDDAMVCRLLRGVLERDGFQVQVVHDGLDAMHALDTEDAPRLVLLDWVMPGVDGLEVCRRLRAGHHGGDTHVFLMSGRQAAHDVLEAFEAGMDEFIPKPFDPQTVVARLHAAERRQQSEVARGGRGIRALLHEIAGAAQSGEVVVRSQERVGRIVVHRGQVAWIHLAGEVSLVPLLTRLGVAEPDARLVFEECRTRGL
ncbi:MAG: response regulator, partial [Myxococcales bacterium]